MPSPASAAANPNANMMIKVEVIEGDKKKYVIAPGLLKRREEESAPFRVIKNTTSARN